MRNFILIAFMLFGTGCSTTLYVAKTELPVRNKQCTLQTFWYKTEHPFGSKADQTLSVSMGEHRTVEYKKEPVGIVYMGEKKTDNWAMADNAPTGERFVCGKVLGIKDMLEFSGKQLSLTMHCKAKRSPLTLLPDYLPPRVTPYVLEVSQQTQFFLFGGRQDAPKQPGCRTVSTATE